MHGPSQCTQMHAQINGSQRLVGDFQRGPKNNNKTLLCFKPA